MYCDNLPTLISNGKINFVLFPLEVDCKIHRQHLYL